MTHDRSTPERRIDSEFGSGVTPPHRPQPLLGGAGGEALAAEDHHGEDGTETMPRYRGERGFPAIEGHGGESGRSPVAPGSGDRTSPFIAGENRVESE
jgi:hypothetical protein